MVTMAGVFDRQKAVLEFRRFVARHGASQARHVSFVASDPPFVEPAEISRGEALDVFFKLHPEHAHHRTDVSEDFDQQKLFSFSRERWGETTTKLSAAKPK
jgi:hypothetical protein